MPGSLIVQLNGHSRTFPDLTAPVSLSLLIETLELKPDRIAVEHNGDIAPRSAWAAVPVNDGDRLEIVHFVGGGAAGLWAAAQRVCRRKRGAEPSCPLLSTVWIPPKVVPAASA
jgi:sulfur carrier protein